VKSINIASRPASEVDPQFPAVPPFFARYIMDYTKIGKRDGTA
jgi:hypothetical protein